MIFLQTGLYGISDASALLSAEKQLSLRRDTTVSPP